MFSKEKGSSASQLKERSARRIFLEHRRPRRSPFSLSPHSECPAEKGPLLLLPPSPPTARLSMLTRRREPCRAIVHWSEARDAHLSRARQGSRFLPPVSRKLQPAATRHANSLDPPPPPSSFLPSLSVSSYLTFCFLPKHSRLAPSKGLRLLRARHGQAARLRLRRLRRPRGGGQGGLAGAHDRPARG